MTPRATSNRRRRDATLGQIPLSSGEIELYSRQDEAARRRRRLLAVRDQERRLAQQVTQRYRQNLQRLQHGKSRRTHTQLNEEQHALLTELHRRYQSSLQNMGTAQRNARAKLLELMEQAQQEQEKWDFNRKITGKQRGKEAQEDREEEEAVRTARRRQVEQNMQRLKLLSGQQRRQASDRARLEQEVAVQRAKDREELEKLRRMQSPEEVFVTPRPHRNDVVSYQFTRTHCLATPVQVAGKERSAVTVIKHNRKHPTAMRGEDEAQKHRDAVDQKRERDRLVVEEQAETAAERGKAALDGVNSRQQGQQALEWLALVDKMERRARGQELGGDDYPLDTGDVGGADDPQSMAERAFAQILGLDEDSVELSVFSIETDDDVSVGLADTDREHSDNDETAEANEGYRVKFNATKHSDLAHGLESGRIGTNDTDGRTEATQDKSVKPLKATSFGENERQEFEKPKKGKGTRSGGLASKGVPLETRSRAMDDEHESTSDKTGKRSLANGGDKSLPEASAIQWNKYRNNKAATEGWSRHRRDSISERPEGTDSEDDELQSPSHHLERENHSIELLESRLQEVLDFRIPRPRREQPATTIHSAADVESSRLGSEVDEQVSQLDELGAKTARRGGVTECHSDASDTGHGSAVSEIEGDVSSSRLPFSTTSGAVVSNKHRDEPVGDTESVRSEGFTRTGILDYSQSSSSGESEQHGDTSGDFLPLHVGGLASAAEQQLRAGNIRGDEFGTTPSLNGEASVAGDSRLGDSGVSSKSSYEPERHELGHYRDEVGHEALEIHPENSIKTSNVGLQTSDKKEAGEFSHTGEVDEKEHDQSTVGMSRLSTQERATELRPTGKISSTQRSETLLAEQGEPVSATGHDELRPSLNTEPNQFSRGVTAEEDSASESSFAPSQKSISRLDQVAKNRARSLGQRFIDQHMLSFSSSEELSIDEGLDEEDLSRRSIGSSGAHRSVNVNPYDPYRQRIDHQARRSSTSAVSVAQYSLPPSDTHTSFDDSLDQLHPGYGEDSFVNELVPLFPKRALQPPPQSLDEDSQALEEYDVQLVAPNMSRMRTSDGRTSFGRSRQRFVREDQVGAAIDHSRRQSNASGGGVRTSERRSQIDNMEVSSPNRRSSTSSSNYGVVVKSVKTSVDAPRQQQRPGMQQHSHGPTRSSNFGSRQSRQVGTTESFSSDNLSEISDSDSGVSSLGFAVQLNLAAGTTRRRADADGRQEAFAHGVRQQNTRVHATAADDHQDNDSNVSERSFASSSSVSMDAHFNYLANMTSAVGKSLPLHLRLPAMIYGKKDMTKPPIPIAWSSSSVSSIASASEVGPNEKVPPSRRSIPRSNSEMSESLLEEQQVTFPRPEATQRMVGWQPSSSQLRQSTVHQTKALNESSFSDSTEGGSERLTFKDIKERVAMLPPPPVGSLDMTQPAAPLQKIAGSHSSSEQSSDGFQASERRHHGQRPYENEDERKPGDSSSDSGASSLSEVSSRSSFASSRRQSTKPAEKIVIPVKETRSNNDGDSEGDEEGKEMSLAEAFKRRHPRFGRLAESHRDMLKRQREQQQQQRQQDSERNTLAQHDTRTEASVSSARGRVVANPLPPEQQELLDRLATGSRAKISSREMKERSRRLYHQLPEVVERKRQEEVMRRRRERLNELREQEKERRLQQKQRRQQQLQHR